jgi:hypothetical protein
LIRPPLLVDPALVNEIEQTKAIVLHSTALRELSRAIEEEAARLDKLAAADRRKKSEQALADCPTVRGRQMNRQDAEARFHA